MQRMPGDEIRVPPQSIESEQSVLGGLLLDNDAIDRIGDLSADHFYRHDHRIIFKAIAGMIAAGKPADVITAFEALRTNREIPDLLQYLNQLAQNTPSAANIKRYAEIVRDRAIRRSIITVSDEIADQAFDGTDDASTVLDVAGSKLEKLAESRVASEPVRAGADMVRHLEVIDQRTQGLTRAIPTGFGDIDRKLNGGIRRGQVIVVAARPKMGKSAFALDIARHVAVDHTALILSMEMPRAELHDRNLAAIGRVDLSHLLSVHGLVDDEWARVVRASQEIEELHLFIDDQGSLRLLDVRMKARLVKRRHSLDLLIIDYLQLMEGQGDQPQRADRSDHAWPEGSREGARRRDHPALAAQSRAREARQQAAASRRTCATPARSSRTPTRCSSSTATRSTTRTPNSQACAR